MTQQNRATRSMPRDMLRSSIVGLMLCGTLAGAATVGSPANLDVSFTVQTDDFLFRAEVTSETSPEGGSIAHAG